MKHIIITGHSKGLGAGMATQLLDKNHHLHGVSRTDNKHLQQLAAEKGCTISFYACDLSDTDTILPIMNDIFLSISKDNSLDGIYLINNAGVVKPIGPVEELDQAEIEKHLRINLLAPIVLIREFIKHTSDLKIEKRVLSISSGAAVNAYPDMSIYCTSKAGLEMFTKSCAAEQEKEEHPVSLMTIAPGIIDTDMQTDMRAVPEEQFRHKQKFVSLKQNGQLVSPQDAGQQLIDILFSASFKNGDCIDVRGR